MSHRHQHRPDFTAKEQPRPAPRPPSIATEGAETGPEHWKDGFDAVPGDPIEWLYNSILLNEASPGNIGWDEALKVIEMASQRLGATKTDECLEAVQVLARLLDSAQAPQICITSGDLLVDTFRQGNEELRTEIRKLLPEIEALDTAARSSRHLRYGYSIQT